MLVEVAGVTVGTAIDNRYGVAFHSTRLGRLGFDETQIKLLRAGATPADATAAAVAALAREVVLNRGKVSDPALAAASAAGLSAEAVLELVLECAFASLVASSTTSPGTSNSTPSSCRKPGRPKISSTE